MSNLIMLVGLPGSGKSTFARGFEADLCVFYLNTDEYIEIAAQEEGKTYNEVFSQNIQSATECMMKELDLAIKYNDSIVWDQTNLTVQSRKLKLQKIPKHYKKSCIFFDTDFKTILQRNEERALTGRAIPDKVLQQMQEKLQVPTKAEGFDFVYTVKGE